MRFVYSAFKQSIGALDRQWDENVFQRQQGMYTTLLKRRLDGIALELMEGLESGQERSEWNHMVSRFVQDYMREFGLKIKSL